MITIAAGQVTGRAGGGPAMVTNDRRPAPYLVCTYTFGDSELPTVRAARDLSHAAGLAEQEAAARCGPVVRVYVVGDSGQCDLVMTVQR
jgi:hypothetical protein